MGADDGGRREPSEPGYAGGLGTRLRGWIALSVYGLAWGAAALFMLAGSLAGGLDMGPGEVSGFVLLCLALGPLLLWAVVKPLCALGRGLSARVGGHRVLWALFLSVLATAALAWGIGAGRGTDAVVGAAALGTLTLAPFTVVYAALRPAGPVRRSPVGKWLLAALLAFTGLGDLWGRGGIEPTHRRSDLDGNGNLRDARFDPDRPPPRWG